MKAVILNAGESKRLRPLTSLKPKCLLRLNGITILEHQLMNLKKSGINNVIIVVGYRASQILKEIEEKNFDLEIEFIQNPIYHKTNTVYSLWLARKHIRDDFIYLNGDVVFHNEVLERLLKTHYNTCIAVEKKQVGEEEVKLRLAADIVKAIGKDIEPSRANGEFIGIAKFSRKFNQLFIDKLNEIVEENRVNEFFEVALDRALKSYNVYAVDVSDLPCIEVDTPEDYNTAKKLHILLG
jgi:choline kinase